MQNRSMVKSDLRYLRQMPGSVLPHTFRFSNRCAAAIPQYPSDL